MPLGNDLPAKPLVPTSMGMQCAHQPCLPDATSFFVMMPCLHLVHSLLCPPLPPSPHFNAGFRDLRVTRLSVKEHLPSAADQELFADATNVKRQLIGVTIAGDAAQAFV